MSLSSAPALGRNDPCYCGSGRKYKHCHLAADEAAQAAHREADRAAEAEPDNHPSPCATYRPQTRKTPALSRADFLVTVRNLTATGEEAWLHVAEPADLGRDQESVSAAIAYLREHHVEPWFDGDPPPDVVGAIAVLLDRLVGQGVCHVEPSGIRLRRYGQTKVEDDPGRGGFAVYVGGRPAMSSLVGALVMAVAADAKALGLEPAVLAYAWAAARVTREVVVRRLELPAALEPYAARLVSAIIQLISTVAERSLAPAAASDEAIRLEVSLPYLLGLREAVSEPRLRLEGMGLEAGAVNALAVQIEASVEAPAWIRQLADLAGDDWDTPEGFRSWLTVARAEPELAVRLESLEPSPPTDSVAASGPLPEPPQSGAPKTAPPPGAEAGAPEPPPVPEIPMPVADTPFAPLDAVIAEHAAGRAAIRERLDAILDRNDSIARERHGLEQQLAELGAEADAVTAEEHEVTGRLDELAEAEASARGRAIVEVLTAGRAALDAAAAAWSTVAGSRNGRDAAPLAEAAQTLREYEDMERRGLLEQLPSGTRELLRQAAESARGTLHERLGGRDPIRLPVVVSASADPDLTLMVGLPLAGQAELTPGSLHTTLAVAVAGVLRSTLELVEETPFERCEHESRPGGFSILRLRLAGPPPAWVSAEECAGFCASELSQLGATQAALREAGVSIEARVEAELEAEAAP